MLEMLKIEEIINEFNKQNKQISEEIRKERRKRSKEIFFKGLMFSEILSKHALDQKKRIEKEIDFFFQLREDYFDAASTYRQISPEIFDTESLNLEPEHVLYDFNYLTYFREHYHIYVRMLAKKEKLKEMKFVTEKDKLKFLEEIEKHSEFLDTQFSLISFEATMYEIYDFLNLIMVDVIGKEQKGIINYINMNIGNPLILEKIN